MENIFLLLGSNLGNRHNYLLEAINLIQINIGPIINKSSIYETAAWGKNDQPDFLNQAIYLQSDLTPGELLKQVLRIEGLLERKRKEFWGARTMDIDILFYGNQLIDEPNLSIPHKLLHERRFVLMPLNEIAPDFEHPILEKKIQELLQQLKDNLSVKKLKN